MATSQFKSYKPGETPYSKRHTNIEWNAQKDFLIGLYHAGVNRRIMREQLAARGFHVSAGQLTKKMTEWNMLARDRDDMARITVSATSSEPVASDTDRSWASPPDSQSERSPEPLTRNLHDRGVSSSSKLSPNTRSTSPMSISSSKTNEHQKNPQKQAREGSSNNYLHPTTSRETSNSSTGTPVMNQPLTSIEKPCACHQIFDSSSVSRMRPEFGQLLTENCKNKHLFMHAVALIFVSKLSKPVQAAHMYKLVHSAWEEYSKLLEKPNTKSPLIFAISEQLAQILGSWSEDTPDMSSTDSIFYTQEKCQYIYKDVISLMRGPVSSTPHGLRTYVKKSYDEFFDREVFSNDLGDRSLFEHCVDGLYANTNLVLAFLGSWTSPYGQDYTNPQLYFRQFSKSELATFIQSLLSETQKMMRLSAIGFIRAQIFITTVANLLATNLEQRIRRFTQQKFSLFQLVAELEGCAQEILGRRSRLHTQAGQDLGTSIERKQTIIDACLKYDPHFFIFRIRIDQLTNGKITTIRQLLDSNIRDFDITLKTLQTSKAKQREELLATLLGQERHIPSQSSRSSPRRQRSETDVRRASSKAPQIASPDWSEEMFRALPDITPRSPRNEEATHAPRNIQTARATRPEASHEPRQVKPESTDQRQPRESVRDNFSVGTVSSRNSLRSFKDLATQIANITRESSAASMKSMWSGHMSLDSWKFSHRSDIMSVSGSLR